MDSWLRLVIFVLILLSFLRRISKARTRANSSSLPGQNNLPPATTRSRQGRKNDFRDIPPPPENPNLG